MTKETTAIMERIREVCPELMELSFGCGVSRILHGNGKIKDGGQSIQGFVLTRGWLAKTVDGKTTTDYERIDILEGGEQKKFDLAKIQLEIIGHPVHLEHLMHVLRKVGFDSTEEWLYTLGAVLDYFDLTLTVEQNLEQNEVLRDFIYSLICKV